MNWQPFWLSLQVTGAAVIGILIIGLALALLLARVSFRGKLLLETIIYLPLVLPPTVVGYYLLFVLGRGSFLVERLNLNLLFTWQAAAIASMIVGLPLMVQTARAAFEEVEPDQEEAARVDGAAEWQVWWYITLPIARRGILAGLILSTARALGEFGATLMVAGNIPGRTQTLPLAIYDAVQARRYDDANLMVLMMTSLAFTGLWLVYRLGAASRKPPRRYGSTFSEKSP
ncbi:molybdate ABC transporter permease subunit [Geitlerinema calcuttense]|uniref:Molybdenum transport system permease n=1 Tax=Geitlerinema calcuttense NRMC-F 0142 TaxID=2922238 RepID=A0ABT7LVZ9_9CYAN|nr:MULTISPECIES: molybdate ABC transporter permease subunit [Cyanophyceae]MDL5055311.1 molybdate ABC transporter permease subunit [Oscillatoria laete-virens NRMC-F 0139]MDL5056216.1 molybdate ABC transporter permease subunit [Geitlerinema calcuttense NRMC-F 0142]